MWVLFSLVSLLFAGVATAAVQQGDLELAVSGSFEYENYEAGGNDTFFTIAARVGYFMTDNIQVSGQASGSWAPGPDLYGLGVSGRYHFMPANQLVPYVGAQIEYAWATGGVGDGLMYGPVVGVRFELNPRSDFFVEYQFQLFAGDLDDVFDNVHAVVFGIATEFR